MVKKTITYTDFNGVERTEDFYFNLTKAEIAEMEMSYDGGLGELMQKVVQEKKIPKLIELFKGLIHRAYGKKSDDGRRFMKNQEILQDFIETEAYSILFMELATDSNAASAFVNGIVPEMPKKSNPNPDNK